MRHTWITPLLSTLLLPATVLAANTSLPTPVEEQIKALVGVGSATVPGASGKRLCYGPDALERFYAARRYAPAWGDAATARQAQQLLAQASAHGLDGGDYQVEAPAASAAGGEQLAAYDARLSAAVLRYIADLHCGRVSSEYSAPFLADKKAAFDPAQRLGAALAERRIAGLDKASQPNFPLYGRIMSALARYRALEAQAEVTPAIPAKTGSIRPGAPYADAELLRRRLVQLGDLADGAAPATPPVYDKQLAEAVRLFQARHGLESDGVLGRGTLQALAVPVRQRARQLELSLERLRWAPQFPQGRVLAVNIPAYRLYAFDTSQAEQDALITMRVIVGKAAKTPTPLFVDQMRHVELNPYWNVPRSIERDEILPKLARDPGYLAKHDMELVPRNSHTPIAGVDAGAIEGLRSGAYRVRQRPGVANALGAVKFVMPNPMSIYLHSTPTRALFARSRRDFSHGCIRVEQPLELAEFVLADKERWNLKNIDAAIGTGKNQWVKLPATVPVVLFYATAMVDRDGRIMFHEDIYKLDPALEKAIDKLKRNGNAG